MTLSNEFMKTMLLSSQKSQRQKRIQVEIGVPSQIEPGQEVEIESVPGIMAHRMTASADGGTVEVKADGGVTIRGMNIVGRNAGEELP